ncbi:CgeB family protein [Microvirga calopogonii]|uniref:CgeB family protein n=1 Tax=Microvirga calopogonii TaxID=2078013 RepID=UPI000E0D64AD|nr:glycosyltransferase [Microvirga calopogonii]
MTKLRVVVLGLSLSSSWGNGHATTFRALLRAFADRGHDVTFLERDVPWYAAHRDLKHPGYCRLEFYSDLEDLDRFRDTIRNADAVIVGSYVPEGVEVGRYVQRVANGVVAFYDIDTPVTLAKLERGDYEYLSPGLIPDYDVYFSFTGGPTLEVIMGRYGSPAARALYCSVDPEAYPVLDREKRWDLSYLGTYSADRQPTLERLLIEPARRAPHLRFAVAGPQYPEGIEWPENVERIDHVPPDDHPAFYAQSRYTLNVTRADMVRAGYSPSVRLFEAAACGTPIISDIWDGIETLLEPGHEIILASRAEEVLDALATRPEDQRRALGDRARRRILSEHTAAHRAASMEQDLHEAVRHRRQEQPFVLAVES